MPPDNALARARYGSWVGPTETLLYANESRLRELQAILADMWKAKGSEPSTVTYLTPPLPADGIPLEAESSEDVLSDEEEAAYDAITDRWGGEN